MGIKGKIQPNHIPIHKYVFTATGLPPITCITISGIEEELDTTELPDRTRATGGNTKPVEFTITMPMHHKVELAALEWWYEQCQEPVSSMYKKVGAISMLGIHGASSGGATLVQTYGLQGVFPTKRGLPELDMANEGDMAVVEWSFSADQVIYTP